MIKFGYIGTKIECLGWFLMHINQEKLIQNLKIYTTYIFFREYAGSLWPADVFVLTPDLGPVPKINHAPDHGK